MAYLEENGSKELAPAGYPADRLQQQLILSGAYPYGAKDELPLRQYLLVLYQYRYVIACCALLGFAVAMVINYVTQPTYSATAVVNIGSYVPPLDGPMATLLRTETTRGEYVKNQIALLESKTIASRVLADNPDILEYLGFGAYVSTPLLSRQVKTENEFGFVMDDDHHLYDIPPLALERYLRRISYTKLYETTMVRISGSANSPEMAARIANAHANAFIMLVRQNRLQAANVNLKFLEKRAQKSAERTAEAERNLVQYALKHGITSSNSAGVESRSADLTSLKANLAAAVLESTSAAAEVRELRNNRSASSIDYSPSLHEQYLELSKIEGDIDQIKRLNPNHPILKALKRQAEGLRSTLRQYSERATRDTELKLKVAQQKKLILENTLKEAERKSLEQSQTAVEYNVLERGLQSLKESHQLITQRLEDAIVNAENDQKTVTLVDPALPPTSPDNLGDTVALWHGLFLGTLLGIGLTILLNVLDNKIRTVADVQQTLNVPVLGVVPAFAKGRLGISIPMPKEGSMPGGGDETIIATNPGGMNGSGTYMAGDSETGLYPVQSSGLSGTYQMPTSGSSATGHISMSKSMVQSAYAETSEEDTEILDRSIVLVSAPFSTESEAFRTVLTTLTYSSENDMPKVIFITSGQQGDGKSTVATNLAVALAEMSGNTLLIDADLRLPTIHKHFNRPRLTPGLADYLAGHREYNEVLCRGYIANLSVMFAGSPVVTPGMLLQSKKMSELLELLSDEFDHIIIDGPPLSHVADSLLLSRLSDGVVMVVRSGKTSRPVAQNAMHHLHQVKANVIGTVLNGVERSRASKQSDYYYVVDSYNRSTS